MQAKTPATKVVTIRVPGMSCGSCVSHIGGALESRPGVRASAVDLNARAVTVTFDPELSRVETIVDAVRKSGYPAEMPES